MKKYLIFISSFAALYLLFQISSGMILTLLYEPELSSGQALAGQEVVVERNSNIPFSFIFIFLSSTIAYVLSQKSGRNLKATNAFLRS